MSFLSKRLDKVCKITMGQAPSGDTYNFTNEGLALIAGAGDFGEKNPQPKKYTTQPSKKSQTGEIILCIRATIGDLNWSDKEYCLGRGVAGLMANADELNQQYLWHWLKLTANYLKSKGKGATFLQVTKEDIASLEIPLPPLSEQKRIADILDKADDLRQKRQQSIAKLDELLQATFIDMFGDPVINPYNFYSKNLSEIALSKPTYGTGSSAIPYDENKARYVRITDINDFGELNSDLKSADLDVSDEEKYLLKNGDIVFARSGATVGKTLLYLPKFGRCIYAGYLIKFSINPKIVLPEYVFYYTQTKFYKSWIASQSKVVAQPNINAQQYSKMPLLIPPLELQEDFVKKVNRIQTQKTLLTQQLTQQNQLFQSLQQQAFNGTL